MTLPPSLGLEAETSLQLTRGLAAPQEAFFRAAMPASASDLGMEAGRARCEAVLATA